MGKTREFYPTIMNTGPELLSKTETHWCHQNNYSLLIEHEKNRREEIGILSFWSTKQVLGGRVVSIMLLFMFTEFAIKMKYVPKVAEARSNKYEL